MSRDGRLWAIRLTKSAEADFREIVRWITRQFGERQARAYSETLSAAITDLSAGPAVIGAAERKDIAKGIFTLHMARKGRKGRHFVMFRVRREREGELIEVLRILHDAMDLRRHLPSKDGEN